MTTTEQNIQTQENEYPEQTVNETIKKESAPAPILVQHGALVPRDNSELVRTITLIAKGGGFPARFKTLPEQMAAYNLSHSLMGPRWQLAINHIANIKGSLMIYGELPGTLAKMTGEVEKRQVYCIDRDYNIICTENKNIDAEPWAGVCKIKRAGMPENEFTYTVDEAKKGGQLPADSYSPWTKWLKVMLMRKANALAIKMEFPDALLGVAIAEYEHDVAPDLIDVSRSSETKVDAAKELNNIFQ